jgi:hypothetical protein
MKLIPPGVQFYQMHLKDMFFITFVNKKCSGGAPIDIWAPFSISQELVCVTTLPLAMQPAG